MQKADKAYPGLSVRVRPCHFAADLDRSAIGQSELEIERSGRAERSGREHVRAVLAQVEQDAFHGRTVLHTELCRNLQRDAQGAAALTLDENGGGSQAALCLLGRNRLIENEMRARSENVPHLAAVAQQGNGDRAIAARC